MGALERISVAVIGTSIPELEGEVARAEPAGIECVWAPELFRRRRHPGRLPGGRLLRDRRGEGRALEMARRTISFYATARTYAPLWELHGSGAQALEAGAAFRRGDLAAVPAAISDEMVETYCAAGPLDKVRARVETTAERADGLFLTPPTYFIAPEELGEFQARIVTVFGPGAPG